MKTTRLDPELGTEKYCNGCGEWWPLDDEFYYHYPPTSRYAGRFQSMCRACLVERQAAAQRRLRAIRRERCWAA